MKTRTSPLVLLALVALPALVPALPMATVTLDVDVLGEDYAACDVVVPAGADGGAVLDAAVAQGCIRLWVHDTYPGYGRYVVCIDVVCGAGATYWALYLNGAYADVGIDAYRSVDGDALRFDYTQWVLPLP